MIALVLTEQLRGRIEERINNITVRQLARLSGAVAAYSAGLIQVEVMGDQSDSEDYDSDEEGLFSGMTGLCRRFRPMERRLGLFALPGRSERKIAIQAKVWKQNRFETKFERREHGNVARSR